MNSTSTSQTGQLDDEGRRHELVVLATQFHLGGSGQLLVHND